MKKDLHILRDEEFRAYMTQTAEPYLTARRSECYLDRGKGRKQYCAFYEAGNETEPPCGVVVISHGFTETADKYYEVIYYFLQMGYHVCIPDHCGHGRSYRFPKEDLSLVHVDHYERYITDLRDAAYEAKQRWSQLPLYLYAHSMGGGIGAGLAAREPELFAGVVLTSPMIRPLTAGIPWTLTCLIVCSCCAAGKKEDYVIGQRAFEKNYERFETSASASQARYDYYQDRREENPLFQMNGASYGWMREAIRLNRYLMKDATHLIQAPLILMQAEQDSFVSGREQERFIDRLRANRSDADAVRLIPVPGTRHEIFNSGETVQEFYWKEIFGFLEKYS